MRKEIIINDKNQHTELIVTYMPDLLMEEIIRKAKVIR